MVAAALSSRNKAIDENNVIDAEPKLKLLTSAAIYGANASGKSNLIAAILFMRKNILFSAKDTQISEKIDVDIFRLGTDWESKPSYFELVFLMDGKRYRYGFEVTSDRIVSEWLYFIPKSREAKLFERNLDQISLGYSFKEGRGITGRVRENALFLSVAAQLNGQLSGKILNWFRNMRINRGIDLEPGDFYTASMIYEAATDKDAILKFIKTLDLDIENITSEQVALQLPEASSDVPKPILELMKMFEGEKEIKIKTAHRKCDVHGNVVSYEYFDMQRHESQGTQRIFALAPLLISALEKGEIVWIDELGARLHPLLTLYIIGLFNDKKTNCRNAQLIFTTHDTHLLSNKLFRRDQIWFMEKDKQEASHLYSLAEFKVRNDASFERDYVHGRYGAIPFIQDVESLFTNLCE
jgi:AAA15 family ATPase/GTPase